MVLVDKAALPGKRPGTSSTGANKSWKWPLTSRISENNLKVFKRNSKDTRRQEQELRKSTSIQGMPYLAGPSKSHIGRIWWYMVITIGFVTACYYVSRQWVKWTQTSIDSNNEDVTEDIMNIPFPAFTICDNRKINFPLNETVPSDAINLLHLICGDDRLDGLNYTDDNLFEWIPPLLMNCTLEYMNLDEDWITSTCDGLMMRTLTDKGVCYTFNMQRPQEIFREGVEHGHEDHGRRSDWHMLSGYRAGAKEADANSSNSKSTGPFPKRGNNAVMLRLYHANNTNPQYCYGDKDGYRITLHNPDEFPMVGNKENPWVPIKKDPIEEYLFIGSYKKTVIDYKSRMIVPADSMSQYSPKQRKCYLPDEKPLSYFKLYSYNNCQLECLTELTKSLCGCIDYYMPRKVLPDELVNVRRICSTQQDVVCVIGALDLWDSKRDDCECMPACTTIKYDIHAWNSIRESDLDKADGVFEGLLVTEIILYPTTGQYVKSEIRDTYTRVDLIVDCLGGIGLIISGIQVVYYLVRCAIRRTRRREEEASESPEETDGGKISEAQGELPASDSQPAQPMTTSAPSENRIYLCQM